MGLIDTMLRPLDDYLIILKRYKSFAGSLPAIYVMYGAALHVITPIGGGLLYVSKYEGNAVIDMGPGFLKALDMFVNRRHNCDPSLSQIHWSHLVSVIITHYHIDHWGEFPLLLSLFHKRNIKLQAIKNSDMFTLYGSEKVIKHLAEMMNSFAAYDARGQRTEFGRYHTLSPSGAILRGGTRPDTKLKSFPLVDANWIVTRTQHLEVRGSCTGVGFVVELRNGRKVGITGDTAYSAEMSRQYNKTDLLVLNVGSFAPRVGSFPKDQHMRLLGAKKFIADVDPPRAVITEFDVREAGKRIDVLRELNTSTKRVLTGDIGMTIRLSDLFIECGRCGNFIDFEDVSQIFVLEKETEDYGIQNLCQDCREKLGKKATCSF